MQVESYTVISLQLFSNNEPFWPVVSGQICCWVFRRDQVWAATGEHCSQSHCSQQTHICKCKILSSSYILAFAIKCPKKYLLSHRVWNSKSSHFAVKKICGENNFLENWQCIPHFIFHWDCILMITHNMFILYVYITI